MQFKNERVRKQRNKQAQKQNKNIVFDTWPGEGKGAVEKTGAQYSFHSGVAGLQHPHAATVRYRVVKQ